LTNTTLTKELLFLDAPGWKENATIEFANGGDIEFEKLDGTIIYFAAHVECAAAPPRRNTCSNGVSRNSRKLLILGIP
jgi:hypothetical protein